MGAFATMVAAYALSCCWAIGAASPTLAPQRLGFFESQACNYEAHVLRRKQHSFLVSKKEAQTHEPSVLEKIGNGVKGATGFLQAAVAGGFAATVMFPVDMAKTRVQTSAAAFASPRARANFPSAPSYRTTLQTLTKVMEEEGAKRWFCGLGPVLIGSAPAMVAQITAYEAARNFLSRDGQDPKDLKIQLAAGIVSGFSHGAVSAPMEVLKVRGQVLGKAAGGLVESVQVVGLQGLFKGVSGCWARDIPFSCIYFPTYSYVKDRLEAKGQPPFVCTMGAGIIAGVLAAAPTTPCDVVKTRLQNPSAASRGLLQTVTRMYTVEGPASFFVGVKPRVGRVAPFVALSLTGYETLKALGASEPVQKMLGLYKEPTSKTGKR